MSIWFEPVNLDQLNQMSKNTMAECIDIQFIHIGEDYLDAKMPVDNKTKQPGGILHGGASCVLAETVGSVAGNLCVDRSQFYCVGLDINANHIYQMKEGHVVARATPLHIGKRTHVWEIKINNNMQNLICISRLTLMVLNHN